LASCQPFENVNNNCNVYNVLWNKIGLVETTTVVLFVGPLLHYLTSSCFQNTYTLVMYHSFHIFETTALKQPHNFPFAPSLKIYILCPSGRGITFKPTVTHLLLKARGWFFYNSQENRILSDFCPAPVILICIKSKLIRLKFKK
jgi:hypothetical protein